MAIVRQFLGGDHRVKDPKTEVNAYLQRTLPRTAPSTSIFTTSRLADRSRETLQHRVSISPARPLRP